jgi:hypothetical protein
MINYLFSVFVFFNNIRFRIHTILNIIKLNNYNKILPISINKNLSDTKSTLFDGYDNRNLSTIDNNNLSTLDIINLTILFNKYDLLEKLKSNNYNENQKIQLHNNIMIHPNNIFNGGLFEDWNL